MTSRPVRMPAGPAAWRFALRVHTGGALEAMQLLVKLKAPPRVRIQLLAERWSGEDLARAVATVRSAAAVLWACRTYGWLHDGHLVAPGPPELSEALSRRAYGPGGAPRNVSRPVHPVSVPEVSKHRLLARSAGPGSVGAAAPPPHGDSIPRV